MIILVDSNIVFSAILNTSSLIGNILLSSHKTFEFYSCHFLIFEIEKHWEKLIKVSKLAEKDLIEAKRLIYKQITFIDEKIITTTELVKLRDNLEKRYRS